WMSTCPNLFRRSMTGMIFPRRLITPSTVAGALGTVVISGTRTISRTEPIRTPNVSFPMRKPTTWRSFSIAWVSAALRARQLRVLHLGCAMRLGTATTRAWLLVAARATLRCIGIQNKSVHAVQQVAGQLQHLLGCRRQFRRARGGLLYELSHLVHCPYYRLGTGGLLLNRRVDFLSDFGQPARRFGNLCGSHGLLVGRRADLLREFVNFGD